MKASEAIHQLAEHIAKYGDAILLVDGSAPANCFMPASDDKGNRYIWAEREPGLNLTNHDAVETIQMVLTAFRRLTAEKELLPKEAA